jgi:hypothetical protein
MQNSPQTFIRPVNAIPADSQAASTTTGTGFEHTGFDQAAVILSLGTLGASGTVDVTVEESDLLASGYAAVSGAAFSQKTQAGTNMSGLIYMGSIDLRGRKKFLRVVCVVGTATSEVAAIVLLYDPQSTGFVTQAQIASEAKTASACDFAV